MDFPSANPTPEGDARGDVEPASEDNPFFVSRGGDVWACWLGGRPAVNLGNEQAFWAAAEKLFDELHPPAAHSAPPPMPDPVAAAPADASPAPPIPSAPPPPAASPALPPQPRRTDVVKRAEERHPVTIAGRLYGGGGSREVTIYDLSTHGCRVRDPSLTKPGSFVSIKLGQIGPVAAIVRWQRDAFIGLKFENALYPSVLDHIRTQVSLR